MSFYDNLKGGLINLGVDKITDVISGVKNQPVGPAKPGSGGLQNFITNITTGNGLFRGTFFEVRISGLNSDYARPMSLLCHQAAFPGFRIETKDNIIYSLPYETPIGVTFDPCWVTCYVDNNFTAQNVIFSELTRRVNSASWSPKYRDPEKLLTIDILAFTTKQEDYDTLDKSHDGLPAVTVYTLKNAFIKTAQQLQLDWGAHNNISSLTFEISYEWFETSIQNSIPEPLLLSSSTPPLNFETVLAKYPALATVYDATKRTILQDQKIMSNPILNQASQLIP